MAFSLGTEIYKLNAGEEMKVKVDWRTYRANGNSDFAFSAVVSTGSGKIINTWLGMEDLKLIGFDLTNLRNARVPTNGEVVIKPGFKLIHYSVMIWWHEVSLNEKGEIQVAKGHSVSSDGRYVPLTINGLHFRHLGFQNSKILPELTRVDPENTTPSEEVSQAHPQNFCNILLKTRLSGDIAQLPNEEEIKTYPSDFLQVIIPVYKEEVISTPSVPTTGYSSNQKFECSIRMKAGSLTEKKIASSKRKKAETSKGKKTECSKRTKTEGSNKKRMNKKQNAAGNKENFVPPVRRIKKVLADKKFTCQTCEWEEIYFSRITRHEKVHLKRSKLFCDTCKINYRSEYHHMLSCHGIRIEKEQTKK